MYLCHVSYDTLVAAPGVISPPELNEHGLHGEVPLPLRQAGQLARVDLAVSRVDAGQVDLVDELDLRRLVRVLVAAVHLERVDAVLVDALEGKDSA